VAKLDDGSFVVMDFKTGHPNEEKITMYARQLHAYALSLEKPAEGAMRLAPVSKMGLLFFVPDKWSQHSLQRQVLEGELRWVEVERDDDSFGCFLQEVINLLEGPLPSPEPDKCEWCAYLKRTEKFTNETETAETRQEQLFNLPRCPLCNSLMRMKKGKYGEFWSCTRFPDCKGTRNA
jgi:hypothetical protein